jgi:hypothetical protein
MISLQIKFDKVQSIIRVLASLAGDRTLQPVLKLSLMKFMREMATQMDDIAFISNGMYLKYALKGKDGQIIKHEFSMDYVRKETFKKDNPSIILIPITTKDGNYACELEYTTYKTTHKEASEFMEHTFTPVNQFILSTNEAVNYNLSVNEIEFLSEVGIVDDSIKPVIYTQPNKIEIVKN